MIFSALTSARTHVTPRRAIWLVAGVAAALAGVTNIGVGIDHLLSARSAAVRKYPASGRLHIVEIDARSIAAINRWPWPRSEHAKVVDALRRAGASTIAFDVDFSTPSTAVEDAALGNAIDRAEGKVILPTFRQRAGDADQSWVDALPAEALRRAATLAAVSILPDADGAVREAPMGVFTGGLPRPSLSSMIAGRTGAAETSFPIDYAIDPASIPRHSFVDVRNGRLPTGSLTGQQVLIGATAIEMGDRYAVPNYGIIPGVVIQALAAETLMRGVPVRVGWPAGLIAALLMAALVLRNLSWRRFAAWSGAAVLALVAGGTALNAVGLQPVLAPGLIALILVAVIGGVQHAYWAFQTRRALDAETGLPNRIALRLALKGVEGSTLVVARIADFDKLAAGLPGEAVTQLVARVCDRLRFVALDGELYRLGDAMLAWTAALDSADAADLHASLRTLMLTPVEVSGRRVDVSLSLGFAAVLGAAEQVIAQASLAAERASADGSGWRRHAQSEEEAVDRELSLLSELDEAVERGELEVVFQPKLALSTGQISSVEALVRWHHPTRGFLRPDLFIPLAERNDRIGGLTLYVVERTIAAVQGWAAGGHTITGAVNLSAKLLSSASFNAELLRLLEQSGIDPQLMIFEVTESAAMADPEAARAALERFRALGIAISMDDYGTGQSTLSYLKMLPLNELKIDRSFVQFAHQNRSDAILVRSTVELAHELKLKVVAEGVEDQPCLDLLRSIGCDYVQGYLISKPVSADAVVALLEQERLAA